MTWQSRSWECPPDEAELCSHKTCVRTLMATPFLTVRTWRTDEGTGASRGCSRVHTGDERATGPHATTCVARKCMETGPKGTHCVIHSDDTGKGEITRGENRSASATKHPCETEIDKPLALNQTHLATGSFGSQLPHTGRYYCDVPRTFTKAIICARFSPPLFPAAPHQPH